MIPVPLLLLFGPPLIALLVYGLRRERAAALVGAAGVAILALIVATAPLGEGGGLFGGDTWPLLGRAFRLSESLRAIMLFVYGGAILLLLLAAIAPQGLAFAPGAILLLAPLAAALLIQPFVFGALLLLPAAALAALMLQGQKSGVTTAAMRCLATAAFGVPLLLILGWMLGADQVAFGATIGRLLALALVILLAGFPFHIWIRPAVAQSPPLTLALVFGLFHLVIAVFGLSLLSGAPWIRQQPYFSQLATTLGGATVAIGGLLALSASGPNSLLAYSLLADIGAGILALAWTGGEATLLLHFVARFISLLLASIGLAYLRPQLPVGGFAPGLAWRGLLPLALFAYGALSLAGLPLTPGFAGRWPIIGLAAGHSPALAALLVLSAAATTAGVLRGLVIWLAPPSAESDPEPIQNALPAPDAGASLPQ
jgi:NADH:ubiquinone oxidoreductase subunit 2 (subunit N)